VFFNALCARKFHDQYAQLHTLSRGRATVAIDPANPPDAPANKRSHDLKHRVGAFFHSDECALFPDGIALTAASFNQLLTAGGREYSLVRLAAIND
jgi:hypothetical protein